MAAGTSVLPLKVIMPETNPHGANQYVLDPRQKMCWELYVNPSSETFGNGLQSALKAGYEEEYAKVITTRPWFVEKIRRLNMLSKAEKVLDETLEMSTKSYKTVGENEIEVNDPQLLKIKQDTAKFVAERVGKEIYSSRSEVTGKDGKDIIPDEASRGRAEEAITSYLKDNGNSGNSQGE